MAKRKTKDPEWVTRIVEMGACDSEVAQVRAWVKKRRLANLPATLDAALDECVAQVEDLNESARCANEDACEWAATYHTLARLADRLDRERQDCKGLQRIHWLASTMLDEQGRDGHFWSEADQRAFRAKTGAVAERLKRDVAAAEAKAFGVGVGAKGLLNTPLDPSGDAATYAKARSDAAYAFANEVIAADVRSKIGSLASKAQTDLRAVRRWRRRILAFFGK